MFCSRLNGSCEGLRCPNYLRVGGEDYCIETLFMKQSLMILSLKEKQVLATYRKEAICSGKSLGIHST